ncbi:unnamed protein product [Staurois parvus]|uniref:Uncharacterized protein n=1 Tax=Staurois parvus TaxID=386267 RepID=A0ABN9CYF5_9NEOB|nr:unnamed protein product [Staurois parvus]
MLHPRIAGARCPSHPAIGGYSCPSPGPGRFPAVMRRSYKHTVNPLIASHVNPFLPSAISTVSVLFISTDYCIGVTGDVSDTKSAPPLPSVRMPTAVPL